MATIASIISPAPLSRAERVLVSAVTGVCAAMLVWAYWPTLQEMRATWESEPDYSHGYLVVPAALFFLWERRGSRPASLSGPAWGGILLLLTAGLLRYASAKFFVAALDGWSLPLAIGGLVWLLAGRAWLTWSWPCIAFLVFMVPLPWRVESYLSLPLQRIATIISCWTLQSCGLPAVQSANTILIGPIHLEVEQACSGLRMIIGVAALTFGYLILLRMEWWQRVLMLVGIIPLALAANCVRIVTTGLLYQWADGESAQRFSHDFAGWLVIPLAAVMLWGYVLYLRKLVISYERLVMVKPGS